MICHSNRLLLADTANNVLGIFQIVSGRLSTMIDACPKYSAASPHTAACVGVGVAITIMSGSEVMSNTEEYTGVLLPRKFRFGKDASTPATRVTAGKSSRTLACTVPAIPIPMITAFFSNRDSRSDA